MISILVAAAFRDPRAAGKAAREQVGRTEREGNTTGDGDFPGRAFHDGVLRSICFGIRIPWLHVKPWNAVVNFNS
jgi:hypothetical protein